MNLSDAKVKDEIEIMGGEKDGLRGVVQALGAKLLALQVNGERIHNVAVDQIPAIRMITKGDSHEQ